MQNSFFERHKKITAIVLILLLFVIMDFTLSLIYNKIIENRERTGLGIKHSVYHHDFERNGVSHETGRLGEYTIYTNSLGFKDKANRKIKKDSEEKRLVFIGDSFTEGILLDYENTFVGIIDSTLADRDIEILNAGRVSYSPIIYWTKIKYLIEKTKLEFDELVVFLDISDIDDEASYYDLSEEGRVIDQSSEVIEIGSERDYGIAWLSGKQIFEIKKFLKRNFIVLSFVINGVHDLIFKDTLDLYKETEDSTMIGADSLEEENSESWYYVLNDYRSNWTFDDQFYNDFGERGKKRMIKYMNNLKQICDENEITMTVVVYPWPSQIWYEDLDSRHVDIWSTWCLENDVKFINLFPSFIKLNASNSEKLEVMNKYFVPFDLHYNQYGNRLIAEEFIKNFFN